MKVISSKFNIGIEEIGMIVADLLMHNKDLVFYYDCENLKVLDGIKLTEKDIEEELNLCLSHEEFDFSMITDCAEYSDEIRDYSLARAKKMFPELI